MKFKLFLLFIFLTFTACSASSAIEQPAKTPLPSTAASKPIDTQLPSPSPVPEPYLLEEGALLDWNEEIGEYSVAAEGIDSIITMPDGNILAVDDVGVPRFIFLTEEWSEVMLPEDAENYVGLVVPDRYVSRVNADDIVEEVLEPETLVLVDPDTGRYMYEILFGKWVEYEIRIMVVGEKPFAEEPEIIIEMPKEVIESCAETVRGADMFQRKVNGKIVELKTGYDEIFGEDELSAGIHIPWYGILCGALDSDVTIYSSVPVVAGFIGVEMNSGDILLITMIFERFGWDISGETVVFDGGIVPENPLDMKTLMDLDQNVNAAQLADLILISPTGTPLFFVSKVSSKQDIYNAEFSEVRDALKNKVFENSGGISIWISELRVGASDTFWNQITE